MGSRIPLKTDLYSRNYTALTALSKLEPRLLALNNLFIEGVKGDEVYWGTSLMTLAGLPAIKLPAG